MKLGKTLERAATVAVLACLITVANADDTTTLPPVRAVPSDLGEIVCFGYDCADVLDGLTPIAPLFPLEYDYISPDVGAVSHDEFCEGLNDKKPFGCDASNPLSTAGTDPNWQPNGCGSSATDRVMMSAALYVIAPDEYRGDPDNPYAEVSFLGACNTHDACWGRGFDKVSCDADFQQDMYTACSTVAAPGGQNVCNGMASIYFGFVAGSEDGIENYDEAYSDHVCAMWAKDMNTNGCPQ